MLHAVVKTISQPRDRRLQVGLACTFRFRDADHPAPGGSIDTQQGVQHEGTSHRRRRASSARTSPSFCSPDGDEVFALDDLSTGSLENVAQFEATRASTSRRQRSASGDRQRARQQGRRRLPPRGGRRREDDRRAARSHAAREPRAAPRRCSTPAAVRQAGARRLHLRGLRRPPHRAAARARPRAGSTARRPRSAGPTPTRRRWTSSSRSPTTRSSASRP